MLVGLVAPLMRGTHIEVTLEFAIADDVTLSVPVEAAGPMGDMGGLDGGEDDAYHEGHAADPSPS
jgi:copper(I)-binding protein